MLGQTRGRFRFEARLGRGGAGTVYRARNLETKRDVAVKVLGYSSSPTAEKRFRTEAALLARLDHPNIVRIHEFSEEEGLLLFSMEYVRGTSLSQVLTESRDNETPLEWSRRLTVILDVLSALHYLEGLGLVHRDIKPANILLDEEGRARLGDFGLARLGELTRLTRSGELVGTLLYMSPEQMRGEAVDHRSDIYQVGLVLYETVIGELPFPEEDGYGQAIVRAERDLDLDDTRGDECDVEMRAILLRACAREAEERFQTAGEFSRALVDYAALRGIPVTAPALISPPPGLFDDTRLLRRHEPGLADTLPATPEAPRPRHFSWLTAFFALTTLVLAILLQRAWSLPPRPGSVEYIEEKAAAGDALQAARLLEVFLSSRGHSLGGDEVEDVRALLAQLGRNLPFDDEGCRTRQCLLSTATSSLSVSSELQWSLAQYLCLLPESKDSREALVARHERAPSFGTCLALARYHVGKGEGSQVLPYLDAALAHRPNDLALLRSLFRRCVSQQSPAQKTYLERIRSADPAQASCLHELATLIVSRGASEAGLAAARRLVARYPAEPLARALLAHMYVRRNESAKACEWARKGLALHPDSPLLLFVLGGALFKQKEYDVARPHLDEALVSWPLFLEAYDLVRMMDLDRKEHAKLLATTGRLLAVAPRVPEYMLLKAQLLGDQNDFAEGSTMLRELLSLSYEDMNLPAQLNQLLDTEGERAILLARIRASTRPILFDFTARSGDAAWPAALDVGEKTLEDGRAWKGPPANPEETNVLQALLLEVTSMRTLVTTILECVGTGQTTTATYLVRSPIMWKGQFILWRSLTATVGTLPQLERSKMLARGLVATEKRLTALVKATSPRKGK